MSQYTINILAKEMEEAYQSLGERLEGLTDEEFFWEPTPGCWTVRMVDGRWTVDYATPDPAPAPMTTLGWRLVHISTCKVMYYEYAFGPGRLTWDTIVIPHTAAGAKAQLEEGHARLKAELEGLEDAQLDDMRLTNWGERWHTWQIFWVMAAHDLHHGGEIGCLRDLYRLLKKGK